MVKTASTMIELGTVAPNFSLTNATDGQTVKRSDYSGSPLLVMFICNHCPFVIHVREQLAAIANDYLSKGLAIVAISANDVSSHPTDGPEHMKQEAASAGYTFPYLFDETQEVAKAYHAACTPDFFVFDGDHKLTYRGQLDDSRPNKGESTGQDLRAAIDATLEGKAPVENQLPSIGCNIKWKSGNEPKYFNA